MVIQVVNIAAGFLLAAPKIAERGASAGVDSAARLLGPHQATIGYAALAFGVIALVERMGILYLGLPMFGSSYPQALPAIASGLLLAESDLSRFAWLRPVMDRLRPYTSIIGIAAMLSGAGSLLFGCVLPVVCPG